MAKVANSEGKPLLDDVESGKNDARTLGSTSKSSVRRYVQKLFQEESNPMFAEDAELAFRAAFIMTIYAIPVVLPAGTFPWVDQLLSLGFYTSGVGSFVVFNLGRTFGEAFENAKSGVRGNFAAAFTVWFLYTVFPDGVCKDSPDYVFWTGLAIGILYVFLITFLNLNVVTQIFACMNFGSYWMNFLCEDTDGGVLSPFHKDYSVLDDAISKMLLTLLLSFVIVLVANMFPYPVLSLNVVEERAAVRSEELVQVFRRMVEYFSVEKPNKYIKDQVIRNLVHLKARTGKTKRLLAVSYWENYGLGSGGLRRKVLNTIDNSMQKVLSLLYNAWTATLAEDAPEVNGIFLRKIKPQVVACLLDLEVVLNFGMVASRDGELSDVEKLQLQKTMDTLKKNEKELTEVFLKARNELSKEDLKVLFRDVRIVEVLAFTLSQILHEVKELADKLLKSGSKDSASMEVVDEISGFKGVFTGLTSKAHAVKAARYFTAYMLCWTIGWFGFRDVIHPRTADLAGLAAMLLSESMGSAVLKDMSRIQGLVIGTVMVRILGSLILGCEWYWVILHIMLHFVWCFGALFVMHHSPTFTTAGCLAAAVGTGTLLSIKCSANAISKDTMFDSLAINCAAVIISMAVDMLFSSCMGKSRASSQAFEALDACWKCMAASLKELMDPEIAKVTPKYAEIMQHLDAAKALGAEAALEPRYWRVEWSSDLWNATITEAEHMATVMHVLEQCTDIDGSGVSDEWWLEVMRKSSHMKTQSQLVQKKMQAVQKLLTFFAHETLHRFPVLDEADITFEFNLHMGVLEDKFLEEQVEEVLKLTASDEKLSKDRVVHLSMVLASSDRVQAILRNIQHQILQHSWKPS